MTFTHTNSPIEKRSKLVRDKIPDIIRANDGNDPHVTVLNNNEYKKALLEKLIEESTEAADTTTNNHLAEELADIYELLDTIHETFNITKEDTRKTQAIKKEKRGGFRKKYYLHQ